MIGKASAPHARHTCQSSIINPKSYISHHPSYIIHRLDSPPLASSPLPMARENGGRRMPKRDYEARVPVLREALIRLQLTLQASPFPVLLVIAGDDASGKGDVVNVLNGWLDPRGVETFAFHDTTDEERERPPLWPYS